MSNSYVNVVEQAISLLNDISSTDYQQVLTPHFSSSIGAHIRHVVDHFVAVKGRCPNTGINYNNRNRYNDIEQFPQAAIIALQDLITWLHEVCNQQLLNSKVLVTTEIDISHSKSTTCESTLEREIVFATSHAIHHYALIRIIRNMQGKELPQSFGYAPATIAHLSRSA